MSMNQIILLILITCPKYFISVFSKGTGMQTSVKNKWERMDGQMKGPCLQEGVGRGLLPVVSSSILVKGK